MEMLNEFLEEPLNYIQTEPNTQPKGKRAKKNSQQSTGSDLQEVNSNCNKALQFINYLLVSNQIHYY
jgi:hypothetical protein